MHFLLSASSAGMPQVVGTFLHTDSSHVCVSQINHFNTSPLGAVFKNSSFVFQSLLLERQECGFLAEGRQDLCILCFPVHFQEYVCQLWTQAADSLCTRQISPTLTTFSPHFPHQ